MYRLGFSPKEEWNEEEDERRKKQNRLPTLTHKFTLKHGDNWYMCTYSLLSWNFNSTNTQKWSKLLLKKKTFLSVLLLSLMIFFLSISVSIQLILKLFYFFFFAYEHINTLSEICFAILIQFLKKIFSCWFSNDARTRTFSIPWKRISNEKKLIFAQHRNLLLFLGTERFYTQLVWLIKLRELLLSLLIK